jgi:hypothetical protein
LPDYRHTFTGDEGFANRGHDNDYYDDEELDPALKVQIDELQVAFDNADFDMKVGMIAEVFANQDLMETDIYYAFLFQLEDEVSNATERRQYHELVGQLRTYHSQLYDEEAPHFLKTCISHALTDNDIKMADHLFREFGMIADQDIDLFNCCLDQMIYFGELPLLVEVLRQGWDKVQDSMEIAPWGITEYAAQACVFEMLDYLARSTDPAGDDHKLLDRLAFYGIEPDNAWLAQELKCLHGSCDHVWSLEDFRNDSGKRQRREQIADNCSLIASEFLYYLNTEMGLAYPRAEMMGTEMRRYLKKRLTDQLDSRRSSSRVGPKSKPMRAKSQPKAWNPFCPDYDSLDSYMDSLLEFLNVQYWRAIAFLEAVPAWLLFLQSKGLIDNDMRTQCLASTAKLIPVLENVVKDNIPSFKEYVIPRLRTAWDEALPPTLSY